MTTNNKEVSMKKDKETKGAVKYTEIDAKGNDVDIASGAIGVLYVRKTVFGDKPIADKVSVKLQW